MKVIFAYYGLSCASHGLQQSNQYRTTKWAQGLCDGKDHCTGVISRAIITDPYYGCSKDFLIIARCSNGQIIADLVPKSADDKSFSLACFSTQAGDHK